MKNQTGFTPIIFILLVPLIVFSYFFLATPHKVTSDAVTPFKPGQLILSGKVYYMFTDPREGDRVVFTPNEYGEEFIGIITKVSKINPTYISNNNNVTIYTIVTNNKVEPWAVSKDEIKEKIYFPF